MSRSRSANRPIRAFLHTEAHLTKRRLITANGTGLTSGGSKDPRLRIESGGEDGCDGEKEILMRKMKRETYWTQEEREQVGTKRKHQKLASVNQSGVMNEKPHTYGRKNEHN